MLPGILLAAMLVCSGEARDGSASYDVEAPKNEAGFPTSVTLRRDDEALGELTGIDDQTPPQPTDVLYQYVFSDVDPHGSDYAVLIWEGGFTGQATAEVYELGEENPLPVATLPCTDP
jgi:hypothetical protein